MIAGTVPAAPPQPLLVQMTRVSGLTMTCSAIAGMVIWPRSTEGKVHVMWINPSGAGAWPICSIIASMFTADFGACIVSPLDASLAADNRPVLEAPEGEPRCLRFAVAHGEDHDGSAPNHAPAAIATISAGNQGDSALTRS